MTGTPMNDDELDTSMRMAAFEHVRRLDKFTITYYPAPHIPTHYESITPKPESSLGVGHYF